MPITFQFKKLEDKNTKESSISKNINSNNHKTFVNFRYHINEILPKYEKIQGS